ncbi:NAD(P)H-flavin reductase [Pseudomonas pohangensis]|uniref:NAD(P)H-flavin reductase n=1 Tax=Pseudomonas pohangensis TaxID=364197 RepID=A0A1H2FTJ4_9PSED|nr:FAD/NAD(P)-binding protein [Pseudomonas pohangensis]SDU10654.1 NAD(P)H-flavin reductase [Pseudomonas pohangensis]
MIDLTPRRLLLLDHYADGEDARHFTLRIEQPQAADLAATPGQFFMLVLPGYGEAPFTYVSTPDEQGVFSALIRRMGALTTALFALENGAVLGYRGPFGTGWPLFFKAQRVLAVAGGCGLAPLAGVIEAATRQPEPTQISLVYGARHAGTQVLARERNRWQQQMAVIETFDQARAGEREGSPLQHFDELFAAGVPDVLLCCGPEALMLAAAEECLRRGMAAESIWLSVERRMHCGVGLCGHCYVGSSYACVDGPTYRYDQYLKLLAHRPQFSAGVAPLSC